jgi:2-polyprenyl-6-methoxyphenol hydroxylase-like FAD-dependent oxidoreductase
MKNRTVLIVGAGIAGTALSYWLKKFGFKPTVLELAPELRTGGYAIDFMGAGYEVAEKMGLIDDLKKVAIDFSKINFMDHAGRSRGSMDYGKIKDFLKGRAFTLLRSDLARAIYDRIGGGVEFIFGDTLQHVEQDGCQVSVTMRSGQVRSFDLLIGADGLHSVVRQLVFGPEEQFEQYLGYYTSSYTIEGYSTRNDRFTMYNVPGKQVAVYSDEADRTTTFFLFAAKDKLTYAHHDTQRQKQILQETFRGCGWQCDALVAKADPAKDFYFDPVSQIKMEHWSHGRIALVGDACYCPSLLSGKGSTLAMAGAYILAGELKSADGEHAVAFQRYEALFKPFMMKKRKAARSFAKSFVPKTEWGIALRNKLFALMSSSLFSWLFLSQFKDSDLELKEYE